MSKQSLFKGVSTLRADEGPTEEQKAKSAALQAYLVRPVRRPSWPSRWETEQKRTIFS